MHKCTNDFHSSSVLSLTSYLWFNREKETGLPGLYFGSQGYIWLWKLLGHKVLKFQVWNSMLNMDSLPVVVDIWVNSASYNRFYNHVTTIYNHVTCYGYKKPCKTVVTNSWHQSRFI